MSTANNTSTSRIGRKPVSIPTGVEVKLQNELLSIKGPKGSLSMDVHPFVSLDIANNEVKISPRSHAKKIVTGAKKKLYRSIAGTVRANINNIILGVTTGFEEKLTLVGVGYRAQTKGKVLSLSLGFSHPTEFNVPEGIVIETPTQTEIVIKGIDKQVVGAIAAEIRDIRPPEPYKGKGVRYAGETVEIKETKKK